MENNEKNPVEKLDIAEEAEKAAVNPPSPESSVAETATESSSESTEKGGEEETLAPSDIESDKTEDIPGEAVVFPSESDTPSAEEKKNKKKSSAKLSVSNILLAVALAVFLVAAVLIGINLIDNYRADKMYDDMNKDFFGESDRKGLLGYLAPAVMDEEMPPYGSKRKGLGNGEYTVIDTNNPFFAQYKEKLTEYKKKNPDIYGWIQVDGTNISYPCVKGSDNDFYLDRTATLEHNVNGAIFADFRCDFNVLENPNLVFYGHNMINPGQMFNEITKFLDHAFFLNNRYVTIYTTEAVYRYEIFAIYQTISTFRYCQVGFMSAESFVNWCEEMNTKSLFSRSMDDFTADSRVVTLSTCTNGNIDDRYSLQARLVSVEKSPDVEIILPDGDEFDKVDPNLNVPLDSLELPLQSLDPEDTEKYIQTQDQTDVVDPQPVPDPTPVPPAEPEPEEIIPDDPPAVEVPPEPDPYATAELPAN